MQDYVILRVVTRILVPFIILFGLYIQFHGELSPGGGFQAGVICAAAFVLYSFTNGMDKSHAILSVNFVKVIACLGVLTYGGTGLVAMAMGGNFLGYSYLLSDPVMAQKLGIFTIELGVGMTVFGVIMQIFYAFGSRSVG